MADRRLKFRVGQLGRDFYDQTGWGSSAIGPPWVANTIDGGGRMGRENSSATEKSDAFLRILKYFTLDDLFKELKGQRTICKERYSVTASDFSQVFVSIRLMDK